MLSGFRFFSPYWFGLLPLALATLWYAYYPRRRPAAIFSSVADLKNLPVTVAQRARRMLPYVYACGLALLIGALARPQLGKTESRIHIEGVAIEMAIDISGSMRAIDFELDGKNVNRITAVKHVVKSFVQGSDALNLGGRPNDLVGLVAFGGFADSKCPLTLDHGALLDVVGSLNVPEPLRDRRGNVINLKEYQQELQTAIGDGLAVAIDRLKASDAKSKILILLTDGDNNAGIAEPLEAAKAAEVLGIKIYTIGVGKTGLAPVPMVDPFGQQVLDRQFFRMDEELLKEIAKIGKGRYYNATDTRGLVEVYADIDKSEKSKVEQITFTEYNELFHWLALPGLALVFGVALLNHTRFRALP